MSSRLLLVTVMLASAWMAAALSAGGQPAAAPPPPPPQAPSSKTSNPDIAVVGNFLAAAGSNPQAPMPAFQMEEVEVSFQAAVDPYARGDFFVSIGQDGSVNLEEGFATFMTLPLGFLAKVGKLHAAFGKVNLMHSHALPWADRPLMTENLAGGDEGITDAGVSVSRLLPNRVMFVEATAEFYRGESAVFHAPTSSDLTYVARLRGYRDLTEAANLDVGGSFAYGHNDVEADTTTELVGVDVTFRYRPLRTALYRRFIARAEMVWSRRSELSGQPRSFGAYISGEYQFGRRWYAGARADYSDRADNPGLTDKGGSLILTYWPSEFSQIRSQYRWTRYAEGVSANQFLVQFLFSIGAHGAHVF